MRGDYSNGRIYKIEPICDHEDNEVYYGSTCQPLSKRMAKHRECYKSWCNGKSDTVTAYNLFEKYGIENCEIYLMELYPCELKEKLHAREGYYIRNNPCVNKIIPGRTHAQYYQDNKEIIIQNVRNYAILNTDKIAERGKIYRHDNKERIAENKNKPCICICGRNYTHAHKLRHERTIVHQKFLKEQETNDDEQDD